MSHAVRPEAPEVPRWRWLLGLMLLVPVALTVVLAAVRHDQNERRRQAESAEVERELNAALAEAQQLDGPWQIADIDAKREPIAEEQNSARILRAVEAKMPPNWPSWERVPPPANIDLKLPPGRPPLRPAPPPPILHQRSFGELSPPTLLNSAQLDQVRGEMKLAADALAIARRLADQPRGRIAFSWPNGLISLRDERIDLGPAQSLLDYDLTLRAQENHPEEALQSCRALLNIAGAIGDTPSYAAQNRRSGIQFVAIAHLERILALSEPPAAALAAFQERLATEAELRPMLTAARGERAAVDRLFQRMQTGEFPVTEVYRGEPVSEREITQARTAVLRKMTRHVEILKGPPEQLEQLRSLQTAASDEPPLVHALFGIDATEMYWPYVLAALRSGVAALAAERYRQRQGRWPDKLVDLVPEFLAAVPADPYDGAPLRYQRRNEGVVIYSVGRDRKNNGGDFETLRSRARIGDVGFRLWNPDRRRQQAK